MYHCEICNKEISDFKNGLVVKIQSLDQKVFEKGVFVHKGDCDDRLVEKVRAAGKNANGSMSMEMLHQLDAIDSFSKTGQSPFE